MLIANFFPLTYRQDSSATQSVNSKAFRELSRDLDKWGSQLSSQIRDLEENETTAGDFGRNRSALSTLQKLHSSINLAAKVISAESKNKYFNTPQAVSSYYVGREALLSELRDTFIQPSGPSRQLYQRRFVVQGMGGSGKTQFCCKFAEENRNRYESLPLAWVQFS